MAQSPSFISHGWTRIFTDDKGCRKTASNFIRVIRGSLKNAGQNNKNVQVSNAKNSNETLCRCSSLFHCAAVFWLRFSDWLIMPQDPYEQQRKNTATYGALAGVLLCGLALLALAALVIPDILLILVVMAGVVVIGILQYVTWGWMLEKYRIKDDDDQPKA